MSNISDKRERTDPVIIQARHDMETYAIPARDYQAYRAQFHAAKKRRIAFRFSLLGWRLWWQTELAKIGPHAKRGRHRDMYVMARKGDRGAYEAGNVWCATPASNIADRDPTAVALAVAQITATRAANGKPRGFHLQVRGDGHPRSKAVITPAGRFGSMALAAEHHGITRAGAWKRAHTGIQGWRLADD